MKELFLFSMLLVGACAHGQRVFLMGDAGEPKFPKDPNFELLREQLNTATQEDVLIFLGDNLYPLGLPPEDNSKRMEMERKLNVQLDVIRDFPGRAFLVPGNHDWAKGRSYGYDQILEAERYIEAYVKREGVLLPGKGCPGPVELNLSSTAVALFLDTQYFLHPWKKPGEGDGCEYTSTVDALIGLRAAIQRNKDKHILVVGHHPLYTYGEHNGNFPLIDHLFPLRQLNDGLWIPLPVLGSVPPFYRKVLGDIQDNTHPKYRAIRKEMISAFDEAQHVVYAAGHEHSLQLIQRDGHHFIVSGSGSKTTHVKSGTGSLFAESTQGFAELSFTGEAAKVKFWRMGQSQPTFDIPLYSKEIESNEAVEVRPEAFSGTVEVAASKQYGDPNKKHRWLGRNYRAVWQSPIEFPVFDLNTERGGLDILKRGGGMQTKSLRLAASNKKQYVLRSVEKFPEKAIPLSLQKTFAADIVQDQISASHPYAAIIVPFLAEPVGIYHANPQIVYLPDDPLLGEYRGDYKETLMLYEERPHKRQADAPFFGSGEDVESTPGVLEALEEDNDDRIDQSFVVRNRLFDMVIGDWDRHDDQWRWAVFDDPDGKGNLYRPIPRDRDQAFFVNEGWLPGLAKRKWALPKIEGFDEEMDWAPGFNHNARFFDRTFMNEPDWQTWQEQIQWIQERLSDAVIDEAVKQWPDTVYALTGARTAEILKARRDDLRRYAREHYLFLSKEVEVVGSKKHEHFLVEALDDERLKVTVRKISGNGELKQVNFERIFRADETKEIRLYGLKNEDVFVLNGADKHPINIRVIGGRGDDEITGEGQLAKGVSVYDSKDTQIAPGLQVKNRTKDDPDIHLYNRKAFAYDILLPLLSAQINMDDGLYLGAGFNWTRQGWRKTPYASRHNFIAHRALATNSYNFKYDGQWNQVFGKWGLETSVDVLQPFFVNNFFGLGNESVYETNAADLPITSDDAIDFYRYRLRVMDLSLGWSYPVGSRARWVTGPAFRQVSVENLNNTFLTATGAPIDLDKVTSSHNYLGLKTGFYLDTRDNQVLPQRGMTFSVSYAQYQGRNSRSEDLGQLEADWAFYVAKQLPARVVLANRVGVVHNTSDYEFFNAARLGGRTNLRGTRRTRFHGTTAFYHNVDLRLKLASFRSYIFPGQVGLLGFHDVGRVWLENEESTSWHQGYGVGLWVSPLNMVVLNFQYAWGEDEDLPSIGFGFQF